MRDPLLLACSLLPEFLIAHTCRAFVAVFVWVFVTRLGQPRVFNFLGGAQPLHP